MTRPRAELIYPAGLGPAAAVAVLLAGGVNGYTVSLADLATAAARCTIGLPTVLKEQLQHYARTRALQAPNSEELLAELVKTYVMSDQHAIRQGDAVKLNNSVNNSAEISFF